MMEAKDWLQLFLTVCGIIVSMLVFYFKNEQLLRKEISSSEERLRNQMTLLSGDVSELATRVAIIEDRDERDQGPRGRLPSSSGRY